MYVTLIDCGVQDWSCEPMRCDQGNSELTNTDHQENNKHVDVGETAT